MPLYIARHNQLKTKVIREEIEITPVDVPDELVNKLLLLADPSKANIEKYINNSVIYQAKWNEQVIGCYVLYRLNKETIEIKNIAVDEQYQGKGIGTQLLQDALEKSKMQEAKKLVIGTGNSSTGQLYLYQKVGFKITDIKTNFFVENYEEAIWENGIQCKDMIMLSKEV